MTRRGYAKEDTESETRPVEAFLSLLRSTSKLASRRLFYTTPHHWHIICAYYAQWHGTVFSLPDVAHHGVSCPLRGLSFEELRMGGVSSTGNRSG